MVEVDQCDLAVWDVHGLLTRSVWRELQAAVHRSSAKMQTAQGVWRGCRVVLGRPLRVTASHLPDFREVLPGLQTAHRPRQFVVVGPAAAGPNNAKPGSAVLLSQDSQIVTRWATKASDAAHEFGIEVILLAAITTKDHTAPTASRPTFARTAGRWLGSLLSAANTRQTIDTGPAIAHALAALLPSSPSKS